MNARAKKIILLLLLPAVLLFSSGQLQKSLNRDRAQLGLTHTSVLENAPPMLAFTTVALGGFRGLISNFLWIRSNDLQQDDKFFEAAQLANWITDLEPHFTQVWRFRRGTWPTTSRSSSRIFPTAGAGSKTASNCCAIRGCATTRRPADLPRVGVVFQHKMGRTSTTRTVLQTRMGEGNDAVLWRGRNEFFRADHPQTAEEKTNAFILREKYKIDPVSRKKWTPIRPVRLAAAGGARDLLGRARSGRGEKKSRQGEDGRFDHAAPHHLSIHVAGVSSRSLHCQSVFRNLFAGPNLDLVPQVNDAYLQMYAEETDPAQRDGILKAHRNFLKDAVYFLYENNRVAEAAKWYKMLGEKYPDKPILDRDPNSFPRTLTLDEYAVARVEDELGDTSEERTTSVVEGLLANSYYALATGQDDRAVGFKLLAGKVYQHYVSKTTGFGNDVRVALPPFPSSTAPS
jgi:hypothetical protein